MICSKCNKSISDDSKFCTFCGISLRPISEESKDSEMSDLKNELDAIKKDIKSIVYHLLENQMQIKKYKN